MEEIKKQIVLCDTDILVDLLRGYEYTIQKIRDFEKEFQLSISVITSMELLIGCRNKKETDNLGKFIRKFVIIKPTNVISDISYELLKQYRLKFGLLIPDALIAGTCLSEKHPLYTRNRKDYQFIDELVLF